MNKTLEEIADKTVKVARSIGEAACHWTAYMFRYPPVVTGKVVDKSYGPDSGNLYFTIRSEKPWELSQYVFAIRTKEVKTSEQAQQIENVFNGMKLGGRVEIGNLGGWLPMKDYKVIQPLQVKVER